MKRYRIGIIGLGGMAQSHIRQIQDTDYADIISVSDVNDMVISAVGDKLDIPAEKRYQDYRRLVNDPDVEVIVSVTPNDIHADVIKVCLEARKPFMAEKPLTRTFEEAQELVKLFQANPVPCMIGFSYRYTPAFRYVKGLIENGTIGRVHHISVQYLQGWGAEPYHTPFVWRFDKNVTGTGTLGDLGSHMIDMARYLVGEFEELAGQLRTIVPTRMHPITGDIVQVEVDDFASFQARLTGDVMGVFQTTRNAIGSGNQHEVSVFGANGTLHASTLNPNEIVLIFENEREKQLVKQVLQVPDKYKTSQWADFRNLLEGLNPKGIPGFMDGFINQMVMEAVLVSSKSNKWVAIKNLS